MIVQICQTDAERQVHEVRMRKQAKRHEAQAPAVGAGSRSQCIADAKVEWMDDATARRWGTQTAHVGACLQLAGHMPLLNAERRGLA